MRCGDGPIPGPMLCFLDHYLLHQGRRSAGLACAAEVPCRDGDDTKALIAGVKGPEWWEAKWYTGEDHLRSTPLPPQPLECAPDLETLQGGLRPRTMQILRWRWGLDGERYHTFKEIAVKLGISAESVAQIHGDAITWLRRHPHAVIRARLEYGLWDRYGRDGAVR